MDDARHDRDRSSRFGEVLQRAYAEDGRALPEEITRLMLDLAQVQDPSAQSGTRERAAGAVPPVGADASSQRWNPLSLMGRLRRRS